jgi:hypothetical protein
LGLQPVWGLPLIIVSVLIHAFGLVLIRDQVVLELPLIMRERRSSIVLAVLTSVTVLGAVGRAPIAT